MVSHAAAKLMAISGDTTPSEVRRALLFSVDFPRQSPLRSRSGGILNEDVAVKMLQWKIDHDPKTDLEWVQGFFCGSAGSNCDDIKVRVKHWYKTNLLEKLN